jgi:hypothetical protein
MEYVMIKTTIVRFLLMMQLQMNVDYLSKEILMTRV